MNCVMSTPRHGHKSVSRSPGGIPHQLICILSQGPSSAKREEKSCPAQWRGKGSSCHLTWRRLPELRAVFL